MQRKSLLDAAMNSLTARASHRVAFQDLSATTPAFAIKQRLETVRPPPIRFLSVFDIPTMSRFALRSFLAPDNFHRLRNDFAFRICHFLIVCFCFHDVIYYNEARQVKQSKLKSTVNLPHALKRGLTLLCEQGFGDDWLRPVRPFACVCCHQERRPASSAATMRWCGSRVLEWLVGDALAGRE